MKKKTCKRGKNVKKKNSLAYKFQDFALIHKKKKIARSHDCEPGRLEALGGGRGGKGICVKRGCR